MAPLTMIMSHPYIKPRELRLCETLSCWPLPTTDSYSLKFNRGGFDNHPKQEYVLLSTNLNHEKPCAHVTPVKQHSNQRSKKARLDILPDLRGLHDSANYDDAVNSQTPCTATRAQPSQDLILFFATSNRPVLAQPGMSAGLRRQAGDNNRRLGGWRERGNARAKGKRKTNVRGEVPRERQQEAARCELHGPDRGHAADQPQTEVSLFPLAT